PTRPPSEVAPASPPGGDRDAVAGARNAGERTSDEDVDVSIQRDVDAHGVGRRASLAHGAYVEAPARATEVERHEERESPRGVHEHGLVEENRAEHGQIAEA